MDEYPSEGETVRLSFSDLEGGQDSIIGVVRSVDLECDSVPMTSVMIVVNDESGEREVVYALGVNEYQEEWSSVSIVNTNQTIGQDVELEILS